MICWVRLDKYEHVDLNDKSETLDVKSLVIKTMWLMKSEVFGESVKRAQNVLHLSIDSLNFSVMTKRLWWELYPLRNPHWLGKSLSLNYS